MGLSLAQLAQISALLEEVLDLDPQGREQWLQRLAPEHRDLEPALRQALLGKASELTTLPKVGAAADAGGPQTGHRFGPYQLVYRLGQGGMAQVWLAQRADGVFRRDVALKLPKLEGLRQDLASRFARECEILAGLEHPGIARLYDAGVTSSGLPYLAMELVAGRPLLAWCDAHRLGLKERLQLFLQVLEAVQYAHGRQVIHRDIKPSNILVTEAGQARLLDFGVAKLLQQAPEVTDLTRVYGRALTPVYASPELLRGDAVEAPSDIYALGVVLYELLAGRRPYQLKPGESLTSLVEQAMTQASAPRPSAQLTVEAAAARGSTPPKLSKRLRGDLDAIVLKALERDPDDRYPSAEALAKDVERYLNDEPVQARPTNPAYVIGKFVQRHRAGVATATAVTVLVAIGIGYELMRSARVEQSAALNATAAASSTAIVAVSDKSIAVLPFVDMSEKHDQEYFSDGLSEELIDLLAKVPDLHVPARTSSFYFKGKAESVESIARQLHVAHVLEGSVRKAGDRLRVTAQLIRADNGYHLWSQTYDRNLKDVFQVQDEIAGAVLEALKANLLTSLSAPVPSRTASSEAHDHDLLGDFFGRRAEREKAVEEYRKAIGLDPKYALAYAHCAYLEYSLGGEAGDATRMREALAMAEKAVALAPQLSEAYAVRGDIRRQMWDWTGAQADLLKALSLDPGSAPTQHVYAGLLRDLGRLPEALDAARKAVDGDPMAANLRNRLASLLWLSGDLASARRNLQMVPELAPHTWFANDALARLAQWDGQPEVALKRCRALLREDSRLYCVVMAEQALGHKRESQQALQELIGKYGATEPFGIAEMYAFGGEVDHAFEWLDRAYAQRYIDLSELRFSPYFKDLRGDPRLGAFLAKMKRETS